ncbi:BTB/POZ protein, partial [Coemansia spiralis]
TVKLASGDGFTIILDKQVAEQSSTIKNMLEVSRGGSSAFTEALTNEIKFPEIKGKVLEKICQYLMYKHRYADSVDRVPEFGFDLEMSLELLMAADYLD